MKLLHNCVAKMLIVTLLFGIFVQSATPPVMAQSLGSDKIVSLSDLDITIEILELIVEYQGKTCAALNENSGVVPTVTATITPTPTPGPSIKKGSHKDAVFIEHCGYPVGDPVLGFKSPDLTSAASVLYPQPTVEFFNQVGSLPLPVITGLPIVVEPDPLVWADAIMAEQRNSDRSASYRDVVQDPERWLSIMLEVQRASEERRAPALSNGWLTLPFGQYTDDVVASFPEHFSDMGYLPVHEDSQGWKATVFTDALHNTFVQALKKVRPDSFMCSGAFEKLIAASKDIGEFHELYAEWISSDEVTPAKSALEEFRELIKLSQPEAADPTPDLGDDFEQFGTLYVHGKTVSELEGEFQVIVGNPEMHFSEDGVTQLYKDMVCGDSAAKDKREELVDIFEQYEIGEEGFEEVVQELLGYGMSNSHARSVLTNAMEKGMGHGSFHVQDGADIQDGASAAVEKIMFEFRQCKRKKAADCDLIIQIAEDTMEKMGVVIAVSESAPGDSGEPTIADGLKAVVSCIHDDCSGPAPSWVYDDVEPHLNPDDTTILHNLNGLANDFNIKLGENHLLLEANSKASADAFYGIAREEILNYVAQGNFKDRPEAKEYFQQLAGDFATMQSLGVGWK